MPPWICDYPIGSQAFELYARRLILLLVVDVRSQ